MKIKSLQKLRDYIASLHGLCSRYYITEPGEWRFKEGPCCAVGAAALMMPGGEKVVEFLKQEQYRGVKKQSPDDGDIGNLGGVLDFPDIEKVFLDFFGKNKKEVNSFFVELQKKNDDFNAPTDDYAELGQQRRDAILKFIDDYIDSFIDNCIKSKGEIK